MLWFLLYLHVKLEKQIISLITERTAPLRRSLNRRCRERAACALISHRCGSNVTNDHRDSLKFVQEVARFVTSHFFGKRGSEKSVNWQHCVRISTHLSVWLQHHTLFQTYTHVQEYLDHGQSEGGSVLHYLWLFRPQYWPNVCLLLNHMETFRVAETLFFFSRMAGRTGATSDFF